MENTENKTIKNFFLNIQKKPLIQKLFSMKIGRAPFFLIVAVIIILIFIIDVDSLAISNIIEIIGVLVIILASMWSLHDIGWPRWWVLGMLIISGLAYVNNEMVVNISVVIFLGIIIVLAYLPKDSTKKRKEMSEITSNNTVVKNKIFNLKTIIS